MFVLKKSTKLLRVNNHEILKNGKLDTQAKTKTKPFPIRLRSSQSDRIIEVTQLMLRINYTIMY